MLTPKNDLPVSQNLMPQGAWGAENISTKDVLIPKIKLMQSSSNAVKQDKVKAGSLVNNTTNEVLADKDQKVELIPITSFRQWQIDDVVTDVRTGAISKKYRTMILMDETNENLKPGDDYENGQPIFRTQVINFFCLIPNKLDGFPFVVPFSKSSLYTGKKLITHFKTCQMKSVPPASQVWNLSTTFETRNNNSYYVLNLEPGRPSTPAELEKAYTWYQTLNKGVAKVDDSTDEQLPF